MILICVFLEILCDFEKFSIGDKLKYSDIIYSEVLWLMCLLDDFLDFSMLENCCVKLNYECVMLLDLLDDFVIVVFLGEEVELWVKCNKVFENIEIYLDVECLC